MKGDSSTATQARFFDRQAKHWDSTERPDLNERLARVVAEAGIAPGMRILDVGTGTGVLIPHLLSALDGEGSICAIDISPGMLAMAKAKRFPGNVVFARADIAVFKPSSAGYDRVMCNAVLPHLADKPQVLAHIYSLLKPGGLVAISHPIGREAVNRVHAQAGAAVNGHQVPCPREMRALLTAAGFGGIKVIDEDEFYLAKAGR